MAEARELMPDPQRRIRYSVAQSLDGFIADVDGGYDWIVDEPGIDFDAYLSKIDTLIMGRGTFETLRDGPTGMAAFEAYDLYVVSTTLEQEDVGAATLIADDVEDRVRALKEGRQPSTGGRGGPPASHDLRKDIWLFGGGVLFRSLLEAGLVDRVEVGVIPVLLGEGIPILPGLGPDRGARRGGRGPAQDGGPGDDRPATATLELHSVERFDSGLVLLKYDVSRP